MVIFFFPRSRRESLISKIIETDNVCACQSFLLMVAADKEGAFYYGDPELVSKFFSQGISRKQIEKEINVRPVRIFMSCLLDDSVLSSVWAIFFPPV